MARLIDNPDGSRTLWISGEMEIPMGLRCYEAYERMVRIAEECGYIVRKQGMSRIEVCGDDIVGYYVLEWFRGEESGPKSIEHWTSKTVWCDGAQSLAACEAEETIPIDELEAFADKQRNG